MNAASDNDKHREGKHVETTETTGRSLYYEGDDPEGFRRQVIDEFGFDVAKMPRRLGDEIPAPGTCTWGAWFPADEHGEGFFSYGFYCPAEHLDALYMSERFPLGS